MNKSTQTEYEKIAALIAATASEDKMKSFAEQALTMAVQSYDVRDKLKTLISPKVTQLAAQLIKTKIFQQKLETAVSDELIALINPAVQLVCRELLSGITKK
ncbi:MAG: hypothetical protein AMJ75_00500 [Phycisphaerae bacterium SM1_79]|nr:MAG: hypothetical protein AMJ75_00500 [Phycisphaerae bacterium SM1_79]